jgi:type III secretory pathway component EscU
MISVLTPLTTGLTTYVGQLRAGVVFADINISPNSSGLPGITALQKIVGAGMTVGLILSVLALIVAAVVWAFGSHSSNPNLTSRGKTGVLIACGAAIITGGAVAFINFFWNVGQGI